MTENTTTAAPAATQPEASEIWAAAQLAPGEGIEDGVARIAALIAPAAQEAEPTGCQISDPDGETPTKTALEIADDLMAKATMAANRANVSSDDYDISTTVRIAASTLRRLHALTTAAPAAQEAEPAFWVRIRSDGGHEGPIPHAAMEEVRKRSGAWTPLYAHTPRPQVAGAVDAPEGCTPADARILRQANHDLAAESFELQTALRGIVAQAGAALARFDIAAAPQAPAAATPEQEEVDFLVRVLDTLAEWSSEDWNELFERQPAIAGLVRPLLTSRCNRPPAGWNCSRTPGHDGPCAAAQAPAAAVAPAEDEEKTQSWYDLAWRHGAKQHVSMGGDELASLEFFPGDFEAFCADLAAAPTQEADAAEKFDDWFYRQRIAEGSDVMPSDETKMRGAWYAARARQEGGGA